MHPTAAVCTVSLCGHEPREDRKGEGGLRRLMAPPCLRQRSPVLTLDPLNSVTFRRLRFPTVRSPWQDYCLVFQQGVGGDDWALYQAQSFGKCSLSRSAPPASQGFIRFHTSSVLARGQRPTRAPWTSPVCFCLPSGMCPWIPCFCEDAVCRNQIPLPHRFLPESDMLTNSVVHN